MYVLHIVRYLLACKSLKCFEFEVQTWCWFGLRFDASVIVAILKIVVVSRYIV